MSNQQYQIISLLSKCFKVQNDTEYSINISTLLHKFCSYCRDFMFGIPTKQCRMKTWVPAASNHSLVLTVQTHKSLWLLHIYMSVSTCQENIAFMKLQFIKIIFIAI